MATEASLQASPPESIICSCAADVEATGILKRLRILALEIRDPNLVYGYSSLNKSRPYIYNFGYDFNFKSGQPGAKEDKSDVLQTPADAASKLE